METIPELYIDLDIPDPSLYTVIPQPRCHPSLYGISPQRPSEDNLSDQSSRGTNTSQEDQRKIVRPVAKLREKYNSFRPIRTETSADKIRKFITKRDSLPPSSESETGQAATPQVTGMSGRSRVVRNGKPADAQPGTTRTSSGYGQRASDRSADAVKRGSAESGRGNVRSKEPAGAVTDMTQSRYCKPPRHDKDKVDGMRDEYLKGKAAANGDVSKVPVYSRGRAATALDSGPATLIAESSRARSSSDSSEDPESRKARIAKYKEQRRKELADKYGLKDSSSAAASSDSDQSLANQRRDRRARLEEAGAGSPRTQRKSVLDVAAPTDTWRRTPAESSLPSSPRSPKSAEDQAGRRSTTTSHQEYQPLRKDALPGAGSETRCRSDSVSSTSSETRTRKDSIISAETQQLVDTLEASRAARRERMRRTISDVSMDMTERIIAKHRARKGSIDSGDGDVFSGQSGRTVEAEVRPSQLPTLDGAPIAHISDSDSTQGSSSGERLRSWSEPVHPAAVTLSHALPDDKKPVPEKTASTKQSRSRSRRQNVSITVAQIKEASAIGQKMVEQKLSSTERSQLPSSPSNSDSSDSNIRKEPASATPTVSSQQVPPSSGAKNRSVPKSEIVLPPLVGPRSPTHRKPDPIPSRDGTTEESTPKPKNSTGVPVKDKRRVSPRENTRPPSPRVTSPKNAAIERRSQVASRSPEKTSKGGHQQSPSISGTDSDASSPSRVRLKRPEIPQVLNVSRQRRYSTESNSSMSDGTVSPTHRSAKPKGSDGELRSPTSSPVHKINRKNTDTSSRLRELARPRRVEPKKEPTRRVEKKSPTSPEKPSLSSPEKKLHGSPEKKLHSSPEKKLHSSPEKKLHNSPEKKLHSSPEKKLHSSPEKKLHSSPEKLVHSSPEKKLHSSPEKKLHGSPEKKLHSSPEKKAKMDVISPSKSENGVLIDSKGRNSPKLKAVTSTEATSRVVQKPPMSRDTKTSSPAKPKVNGTTTKQELSRPSKSVPPKTASRPPKRSSESVEQLDVKKVALATKDQELIAMMRARALSLKEEDGEEEVDGDNEGQVEGGDDVFKKPESQEEKLEDVIRVPVAERLQVFRSAEMLDIKPPIPSSPSSPRSPRSPRRSSQIKIESQEADYQRPSTPIEKSSETDQASEPDELATLSVSAKKYMFTQISKQKDAEVAKAKPRRRFHRIHQSERSQTQPVTPEELTSAATLANQQTDDVKELELEEDDVARLSLADKMKLFHEKAEFRDTTPPKADAPKRKRRADSRFKTQPVTVEEVKEACSFSPLARSFSRPPDEVAGLPLAEQIALVYGSAEKLERRTSMSSGRREPSASPERKGILKGSSLDRPDSSPEELPTSILKTDSEAVVDRSPKKHSILKSEDATVVQSDPEAMRSILKDTSESLFDSGREKDDPDADHVERSILKKESTSERPPLSGIMRKTSVETSQVEEEMSIPRDSPRKAALKKEDSQDADVDSGADDPVRSKSALAVEQLRHRKGKAVLRTDGYSSSDSEPEIRVRAVSTPVRPVTPVTPIVEIRTVRKKQLPELDVTKKRPKSPADKPKGGKDRRLKISDQGRHKTQPVTPEEMAQVRRLTEPVQTSSSIKDRLSALKKSGKEDWQKRINKYDDSPPSRLRDYIKVPGQDPNRQEEGHDGAMSSISKRLERIQTSQGSWKTRIEEKDATQFTVSGKMSKAGKEVIETPPQLKRGGSLRIKRGGSFRNRVTLNDKDGEEKKDAKKEETKEDVIDNSTASNASGGNIDSPSSATVTTATATSTETDSDSAYRIVKKKVAIMRPDSETFDEFFTSSSTIIASGLAVAPRDRTASLEAITVSDFDALSDLHIPKLTPLSRNRMSLRPKRRAHGTKNPIRALRTRSNIMTEYEEIRKEVVETQTPDRQAVMQSRRVQLSSKSSLTSSARKGLASKEDIAKGLLKLQKVKDVRDMDGKLSRLLPYKELMLIQVKGRRFVQVRMVEPLCQMLNTGDCFVLVTPKECFLWIGEYSNVIERSKAAEISQLIQCTRDLGCKAPSVVTIEEAQGKPKRSNRDWKAFMEVLGGSEDVKDIGRTDEDEMHEIYITETNMVYKVDGESLIPYDDYWGAPPKFAMLQSNEILVLDFGSELYIWQGKQTTSKERQMAAKLAQIIWERGFDYKEFDINPIWPGHSKKQMHGLSRPDWALFGKTTEHMETVLFQNKFIDWPSESRLIKGKLSDEDQKNEPAPELVPYDASKMIQPNRETNHLTLENTNLGRGKGTNPSKSSSETVGFNKIDQRGNEITTLSVVVWHVLEYEHSILPKESFGQFHEGDTYVVRWQYRVESTGMRDLKGNLSKRQGHGRERCAYFFWQGLGSTINEKGASALMTVELDDERGPQRQVIQGKEPPAFLQLFDGRMVVHLGKREEESTNTAGPCRLYCVRSEHTDEALLLETECESRQLRSRTSFLLLGLQDVKNNRVTVYIWHGVKSSKASRAVATHAANMLKENKPMEMDLSSSCLVTIEDMEEGKETNGFKKLLALDRTSFDSAIGDPLVYNYTPRLFHLTSKSGVFISIEILNQSRSEETFTSFPFLQSDLYSVSQPAQFLFDNHYEVYLWQGWWSEDQDKRTGSVKMRWDNDRRCAMETVIAYCKEKRIKNPPKAYLVHAGLEPMTFKNLFPYWKVDERVADINKTDGKTGDRAILVSKVLEKLAKSEYTFADLQVKPLPDGVDPLKLETYLSEEEFKEVLKMGKEEFNKIPPWKQRKIKKEVGLF